MDVFIEERVFMSVVMSAAEVYKCECYGCLVGYKQDDVIVVDNAIPYQSADRSFSAVDLKKKQRNRITSVLGTFPKQSVVGEFHSHPQYGRVRGDITLSRCDMRNVNNSSLEIVVAINDKKRSRKWSYNADMSISGTFDDYHVRMVAYCYGGCGKRRPRRVRMWCPVLMGDDGWRRREAI